MVVLCALFVGSICEWEKIFSFSVVVMEQTIKSLFVFETIGIINSEIMITIMTTMIV